MKAIVFRSLVAIMILGCLLMPAPQPARAADVYLVVNSTSDGSDSNPGNGICVTTAGTCTLRAAIEESHATSAVHETIIFDISGSGPHTIFVPEDSLFQSVESASIVGPNLGNQAVIILDGNGLAESGLTLNDNDGTTISGLRIQNFAYVGIRIIDGKDITIANNVILNNLNTAGIMVGYSGADPDILSGALDITGNIIGVNPDDNSRQMNIVGIRIELQLNDEVNITIGGALPEKRNIIAGSITNNISIKNAMVGYPIRIQGNYIGTNPAGTLSIPNGTASDGYGIFIENSYGVVIGGSNPGEGNLISSSQKSGIYLSGACAQITIEGNQMSTNAAGTAFFPNAASFSDHADIFAVNAQLITVNKNTMLQGLKFTTDTNGFGVSESTIFGNKFGITDNDFIRPAASGQKGLYLKGTTSTTVSANDITGFETGIQVDVNSGVTLRQNKIWGNQGLGIDLVSAIAGVTPNDNLDADSGPNGLQNFPVITGITKTNIGGVIYVDVTGTYHSQASANYRIELFNSVACDANGYGEGQKYIAYRNVTTDASGNANWSVTNLLYYPTLDLIGRCFTATATQVVIPTGPVLGNTSEFSGAAYVERVLFLPLIRR